MSGNAIEISDAHCRCVGTQDDIMYTKKYKQSGAGLESQQFYKWQLLDCVNAEVSITEKQNNEHFSLFCLA